MSTGSLTSTASTTEAAREISSAVLNDFDRTAMKRTARADSWQHLVAPFRTANTKMSMFQLISNIVATAGLEALAFFAWPTMPVVTALATILAAGFSVRTFIAFHDCCHGSFFNTQRANDLAGIITGILVLTPYHVWRKSHCIHHATTGDLDRRGTGDVLTMTVDEYLASSRLKRAFYRVYRNPFAMMLLGFALVFLILNRIPGLHVKDPLQPHERRNVHVTTLGVIVTYAALWLIGGWTLLAVHFVTTGIAGMAGVFLFYVQHQYEGVYWKRHNEWEYLKASMQGSSWLKLPKVLAFFSGNIGVHHVHHLAPKVPNYHLDACALAVEESIGREVTKLSWLDALKTTRLKLWDEANQRLIGWDELDPARVPSPAVAPAE